MMPVVRSGDGRLSGGFWVYIQRGAWRILPPYYIAIAVSLLLILVISRMNHASRMPAAFGTGQLLSHMVVIHNLSPKWA